MPSQRSALTPFQSKCGGPRLGLSLALKLTARKDKTQWCSCYTDQQLTTTVSTLSLYLSIHATLRERSRLGQGDKVGKGKSVIKRLEPHSTLGTFTSFGTFTSNVQSNAFMEQGLVADRVT